ncbi:TetR/AcrR family transcriptional regulator [Lactobacillus kefiranofaciens]|uniref:TetR/AcrR family transcriptional regulator n=1 Tax=Lactobacillus kefiranofaciens TaxID=267818 RepID=A0AAX3UCQ4_9LACO|nr:TetR/AcrR family transcriptional regulator [Lactobacillus kefiranofaciens]AEG41068.1 Transcriptional regulator [Lactobacillus kefiranofaciens subsp. kefiranofaciens]KRL29760.1 ArsR family transcriptional regulator [Lactobacillus kefiranofaciens subsp. kefirgranum DSM 10550 = JCM 8572]KRM20844.1 ArsR family transcriptional regulator [Lactobacillus kefiranofaciens subsp. kefiranofaciens DSM 5016 = JCM 6985]MCJ2172292.1 TetR/AcrR family transcriptional regulator [Lactobacillus kefiranofaciens]
MARRKEISKDKILDTAYKMAVKDGLEGLTARSIAKAGHFSTQPLYLEFDNMGDLRAQVLKRISKELRTSTLQQKYTGEPLIDLDLSYIDFAKTHVNLFRAMFVNGKFGSKVIADTLMDLGVEKFKEQYSDTGYDADKIHDIVIANWILTTGMAALVVNEIASFSQNQIVNVLNAQIHDAMLNDRLSETEENPMFAADDEASLKDNLA